LIDFVIFVRKEKKRKIWADITYNFLKFSFRSTSIILVDKKDNVGFYERRVLDIAKPMDDPSKFEYSFERFLLEKY